MSLANARAAALIDCSSTKMLS